MLGSATLMAMVPVVDMDRARGFYEGKLGLTHRLEPTRQFSV